jgi:hypothetical protein
MRKFALILATALALLSCSHPAPPVGRWEGTYEVADTMIAARLEIASDGQIRVSAPNLQNIGGASEDDRVQMREKLASDLDAGWEDVAPRPMDFDGSTFRKPGGIAPQMIWKGKGRQMWVLVYLGTQPGTYIAMREVSDFSDNPWRS